MAIYPLAYVTPIIRFPSLVAMLYEILCYWIWHTKGYDHQMVVLAGVGKAHPYPQCASISMKVISVSSKVLDIIYMLLDGCPE